MKKSEVLQDLYACLLTNKPIPRELSDAFMESYLRGRNGEVRSWDDVFGKPTRYGTGEKIKRRIEQERLVAEEVARVKAEGGSLNQEEFQAIGGRRGVAVGAATKVKGLLRSHRYWTERVNELIELGRTISKNSRR